MSIHKLMIEFHTQFHGAKKTGVNPHYNSEHFTLEDITRATTPILNKLGLFVAHRVDPKVLVTSIYDGDGNRLDSMFPLPEATNPQALGSAITYGKRYNLCALLNIAEADDDGEAASIGEAQRALMVSDATAATLRDYLETVELSAEQSAFFEAHPIDTLTEAQAEKILAKLKTPEMARQRARKSAS